VLLEGDGRRQPEPACDKRGPKPTPQTQSNHWPDLPDLAVSKGVGSITVEENKEGLSISDWIRVSKLEGWYGSKVRDNHPLRSCKISQIAAFRFASQPEGGVE
jgi:hypothetical protein